MATVTSADRPAWNAQQQQIEQQIAAMKADVMAGYKDRPEDGAARAAELEAEARKKLKESGELGPAPTWDPYEANWAYGGQPGLADQDVARFRAAGANAATRGEVQADYSQADFARALGMQARGSQTDALGLYAAAARGEGPSAAQAQFQAALDQAQRAQASQAASARGGALARAAANRIAMNNAADMSTRGAAAAAALRAQEMQSAMAGYAGVAGQQRGQDLGLQGQETQAAGQQADLRLKSRAQNDATQLSWEQLGMQTRGLEQTGNLAMMNARTAKNNAADQRVWEANQAATARAAQRNEAIVSGTLAAGGAIAGTLVGGPAGGAAGAAAGSAAGKAMTKSFQSNYSGGLEDVNAAPAPAPAPSPAPAPAPAASPYADNNDELQAAFRRRYGV